MASQIFTAHKLWMDGFDLSGDIRAMAIQYGAELREATVLSDQGRRRRAGLKSVAFDHEGYWNGGAGNVDDALFAKIGANDVPISVCPLTGAEGDLGMFFRATYGEYVPGAAVGEMFAFSVSGEASDGNDLIRGTVMHNATRTATANGTARNLGSVSATQKLYAALHVLDPVAGTTPTLDVKVQSDDGSGFLSPTDRVTFAQKTAKGSEYATPVAGAITDTWWRITWTIGGTGGPSFPFVVLIGIQ